MILITIEENVRMIKGVTNEWENTYKDIFFYENHSHGL